MQLIRGISGIQRHLWPQTAMTIGNFDGVHLGHQAMLKKLVIDAKTNNLATVVVLFEPQPVEFFRPDNPPARLSSLREKLAMLKKLEIDYVVALNFNHAFSQISAHDFMQNILHAMNPKIIHIGHDFRFGQGRLGNLDTLKDFCKTSHISLSIQSEITHDQDRISSTAIRFALDNHLLLKAKQFLGRDYTMQGRVIRGDGRGRLWGVPTANIAIKRRQLAIRGVFLVEVNLEDSSYPQYGIANIGYRPTIDGKRALLEVHLFEKQSEFYGKLLTVKFLDKIRDEKKFESVDLLIAQIHEDVREAKKRVLTHG